MWGAWLAVGGACDSRPWGHEFEPHVGCGDYYETEEREREGKRLTSLGTLTWCCFLGLEELWPREPRGTGVRRAARPGLQGPALTVPSLACRLVAVALLYLEQEDAFWCLVTIVEVFMPRDYYTKTLLGSQVRALVLRLGQRRGAGAKMGPT